MLTFRMIDWVPIQQRLVEAGYNDIPNGHFHDSYRIDDYLYFIIAFDTPADEMWFKLKWL